MKIRADFVTNSSSTSYLVLWPRQIKEIQDVSEFIPNSTYANVIFKEAIEKSGISVSSKAPDNLGSLVFVAEKIRSGHVEAEDFGLPEHDLWDLEKKFSERENVEPGFFFKAGMMELLWDEHFLKEKIQSFIIAQMFLEKGEGFIYHFTYSDEGNGLEAEMESANPFQNLPCIVISHR